MTVTHTVCMHDVVLGVNLPALLSPRSGCYLNKGMALICVALHGDSKYVEGAAVRCVRLCLRLHQEVKANVYCPAGCTAFGPRTSQGPSEPCKPNSTHQKHVCMLADIHTIIAQLQVCCWGIWLPLTHLAKPKRLTCSTRISSK